MDQTQRDEMIQKIRAKVVEGSTIANACKELGVNYQTYFGWTAKKKGNKKVAKPTLVTKPKTNNTMLVLDLNDGYSYQITANTVTINKL